MLTLPFSRLYDRMGDDMQEWCDTRIEAARPRPQWIWVRGAVLLEPDGPRPGSAPAGHPGHLAEVHRAQDGLVRLIDLDASPAKLRDAFQQHPSTQHIRKFSDDDLIRPARRLESDALNELNLFLAYAYRLGYHKMLVYPFRPEPQRPGAPPPPRAEPAEPVTPDLRPRPVAHR